MEFKDPDGKIVGLSKIARLVDNQSSRLGALLDPLVDRVYMLAVPLGLGFAHVVPLWLVITLIGRDLVLLPVSGFPIRSQWHLVHPRAKQLSPIAQVFREHLLGSAAQWAVGADGPQAGRKR